MEKQDIARAILENCDISTEREMVEYSRKPIMDKVIVSLLGVIIYETDWKDDITEDDLIHGISDRYCDTGLASIYGVSIDIQNVCDSTVSAFLQIEKLRRKLDWVRPVEIKLSN